MKPIDSFTNMCVDKGYITREDAPWLHYGMEKRIMTFLISIPMLIVGSLISSPIMTASFYISFYMLRSRTSGFHTKSFGACFFLSISTEVFFLGILPRIWNEPIATGLLFASIIIIFTLAPFNHPSMSMSSEELNECARSAKKRLSFLILFLTVMYAMQLNELAAGILLGIVMVAVTLTFAYIPKGEKKHEKAKPSH